MKLKKSKNIFPFILSLIQPVTPICEKKEVESISFKKAF